MVEIKEEDYKKVKEYLGSYVELLKFDIEKLHDEDIDIKEKMKKADKLIQKKFYAQELIEKI